MRQGLWCKAWKRSRNQSSKLITRVRFPSSAPLGKGSEIQQNEWVSGHFLISGTPTSVARLNRTPIVGLKKFRFDDRRRHYDDGFRREALELIKAGAGKGVLAGRLAIPAYTARNWIRLYRSGGEEAVMGSNGSRRYDWETKVAAARDRVEDGMTKTEVMARYGVASVTALQRWCREYRAGGAEALRPRPKGRPKGARSKPKPKPTREQELAEQVAYLKAKGKAKSETRARFEAKLAEYERLESPARTAPTCATGSNAGSRTSPPGSNPACSKPTGANATPSPARSERSGSNSSPRSMSASCSTRSPPDAAARPSPTTASASGRYSPLPCARASSNPTQST